MSKRERVLFPVLSDAPDSFIFIAAVCILGVLFALVVTTTWLNLDDLLSAPIPVALTGVTAENISPIATGLSLAFGVLLFLAILFYLGRLYG